MRRGRTVDAGAGTGLVAGRGRVREWAVALDRTWSVSEDEAEREAAGGARAYVAYIDDGLADYLRGYLFWLTEHRSPAPGAPLPNL
ncbi:hypothetical protein [Streptomyces manipurensis]|uniref:hypothetical protein n=1 Tax=Streptomyces manipurensis TaxID=1077945 RepID=UPI003C6EA6D9